MPQTVSDKTLVNSVAEAGGSQQNKAGIDRKEAVLCLNRTGMVGSVVKYCRDWLTESLFPCFTQTVSWK
jgi:hypothetical protein